MTGTRRVETWVLLSKFDNPWMMRHLLIMSLHVNLTPELEEIVRGKVRAGLYGSASEVVREALRLLIQRDERRPPREGLLRDSQGDDNGAEAAAALRTSLEMLQLALALTEQGIRREHPNAREDEIQQQLSALQAARDSGEEAPGFLERSPTRLKKLLRASD